MGDPAHRRQPGGTGPDGGLSDAGRGVGVPLRGEYPWIGSHTKANSTESRPTNGRTRCTSSATKG